MSDNSSELLRCIVLVQNNQANQQERLEAALHLASQPETPLLPQKARILLQYAANALIRSATAAKASSTPAFVDPKRWSVVHSALQNDSKSTSSAVKGLGVHFLAPIQAAFVKFCKNEATEECCSELTEVLRLLRTRHAISFQVAITPLLTCLSSVLEAFISVGGNSVPGEKAMREWLLLCIGVLRRSTSEKQVFDLTVEKLLPQILRLRRMEKEKEMSGLPRLGVRKLSEMLLSVGLFDDDHIMGYEEAVNEELGIVGKKKPAKTGDVEMTDVVSEETTANPTETTGKKRKSLKGAVSGAKKSRHTHRGSLFAKLEAMVAEGGESRRDAEVGIPFVVESFVSICQRVVRDETSTLCFDFFQVGTKLISSVSATHMTAETLANLLRVVAKYDLYRAHIHAHVDRIVRSLADAVTTALQRPRNEDFLGISAETLSLLLQIDHVAIVDNVDQPPISLPIPSSHPFLSWPFPIPFPDPDTRLQCIQLACQAATLAQSSPAAVDFLTQIFSTFAKLRQMSITLAGFLKALEHFPSPALDPSADPIIQSIQTNMALCPPVMIAPVLRNVSDFIADTHLPLFLSDLTKTKSGKGGRGSVGVLAFEHASQVLEAMIHSVKSIEKIHEAEISAVLGEIYLRIVCPSFEAVVATPKLHPARFTPILRLHTALHKLIRQCLSFDIVSADADAPSWQPLMAGAGDFMAKILKAYAGTKIGESAALDIAFSLLVQLAAACERLETVELTALQSLNDKKSRADHAATALTAESEELAAVAVRIVNETWAGNTLAGNEANAALWRILRANLFLLVKFWNEDAIDVVWRHCIFECGRAADVEKIDPHVSLLLTDARLWECAPLRACFTTSILSTLEKGVLSVLKNSKFLDSGEEQGSLAAAQLITKKIRRERESEVFGTIGDVGKVTANLKPDAISNLGKMAGALRIISLAPPGFISGVMSARLLHGVCLGERSLLGIATTELKRGRPEFEAVLVLLRDTFGTILTENKEVCGEMLSKMAGMGDWTLFVFEYMMKIISADKISTDNMGKMITSTLEFFRLVSMRAGLDDDAIVIRNLAALIELVFHRSSAFLAGAALDEPEDGSKSGKKQKRKREKDPDLWSDRGSVHFGLQLVCSIFEGCVRSISEAAANLKAKKQSAKNKYRGEPSHTFVPKIHPKEQKTHIEDEAMSEIISIWGRVSEFVCDNIKQLQATGVASPALGMAGLCMQFHLLTMNSPQGEIPTGKFLSGLGRLCDVALDSVRTVIVSEQIVPRDPYLGECVCFQGSVCFFENVCRSMHSFSPPPSDVFFSLILAVVLASRPNGDLFVSSGRECVRILAASVSPHHFALLMKTILLQLSSPFPHQVHSALMALDSIIDTNATHLQHQFSRRRTLDSFLTAIVARLAGVCSRFSEISQDLEESANIAKRDLPNKTGGNEQMSPVSPVKLSLGALTILSKFVSRPDEAHLGDSDVRLVIASCFKLLQSFVVVSGGEFSQLLLKRANFFDCGEAFLTVVRLFDGAVRHRSHQLSHNMSSVIQLFIMLNRWLAALSHAIETFAPKPLPAAILNVLLDCCRGCSRVLENLSKEQSRIRPHVVRILSDVIHQQQTHPIHADARAILNKGIFALIDNSEQYHLQQLQAQSNAAAQVIFRALYADYQHNHKYRGAA